MSAAIGLLQQHGFKVEVTHNRRWFGTKKLFPKEEIDQEYRETLKVYPRSKGGSTQVTIYTPTGLWATETVVCSNKDVYTKAMGIAYAGQAVLLDLFGRETSFEHQQLINQAIGLFNEEDITRLLLEQERLDRRENHQAQNAIKFAAVRKAAAAKAEAKKLGIAIET